MTHARPIPASGRGTAREGSLSKAVARHALQAALDTIRRTARALALDTPGLDGKFLVPRVRADRQLATAARTFAQDAAPLKAQFVAHGLPKSFLADLQAALDAFDRATADRAAAHEANAVAQAGISAALESASLALARLDAIVPNVLRDDPTLRAAWASARHVARVRTRVHDEPTPSAPGVQPEPPAAPVTTAAGA